MNYITQVPAIANSSLLSSGGESPKLRRSPKSPQGHSDSACFREVVGSLANFKSDKRLWPPSVHYTFNAAANSERENFLYMMTMPRFFMYSIILCLIFIVSS